MSNTVTEPVYLVRRCMVTSRKFVVLCDLQTDDTSLQNFKICLILRKMGRPHYAVCSMYIETIDLYTLDALETIKESDMILMFAEAYKYEVEYGKNWLSKLAYEQAVQYILKTLTVTRPTMGIYRDRSHEIMFLKTVVKTINTQSDPLATLLMNITTYLSSLVIAEVESRFYGYKARTIQRRFRSAIANPYTLLCKSRLMREFGELSSTQA